MRFKFLIPFALLLPLAGVGIAQTTVGHPDNRNASNAQVTATGGTTAATLANTMPISVLHFGAKCDGSTDDSAAFQAAANLGRRISVPAGICKINSTINIVNGTQFVGQGRPLQYSFAPTTGTTLDFVGAAAGADGFNVSGGGTVQMAYFADMQIERAPGSALNIACVYCALDRVSLAYNTGNGATFTTSYLTSIRSSFIEQNGGKGVVVTSGTQGSSCQVSGSCYTTVEIVGSEADHNASDGWYVLNQHSTTFISTGSDHNGTGGTGYGYNIQNTNASFISTDAETNANSGYYFYGSRITMVDAVAGGNDTSLGATDANHVLADNGSQVWIISGRDWNPTGSYSLNAINSSNILGNNNIWATTQHADGTSFTGNQSGTISFKPTSGITFNNAGGSNAYGLYGDATNTILNVATGGTISFRLNNTNISHFDSGNHLSSDGTAPTVSSCGTSPSTVTGTDITGTLTLGTGSPTACTLTFAKAFASAPKCEANLIVSGTPVAVAPSASSTTAVTFTAASAATSGTLTYRCGN